MHTVAVLKRERSTCERGGRAVPCTLLHTEGLPGQGRYVIEVDDSALSHRQAAYGLDATAALAAIVREHAQRLGKLPEHPSHPWGGLRPDVAVAGL